MFGCKRRREWKGNLGIRRSRHHCFPSAFFLFNILHLYRGICIQIEIYLSTWHLILNLPLFCLGSESRSLVLIAYVTCCLVGVKRRHRFVSGFQGCAFLILASAHLLPMRILARIIPVTEISCRSGAHTVNFTRFPLLAQRVYTTRPALFATYSIGRRKSSSMASESLNSSQTDVRDHDNRGSTSQSRDRLPHAAGAAAGAKAASPAFFPLGYREGFSQWVCGLPEQLLLKRFTKTPFHLLVGSSTCGGG